MIIFRLENLHRNFKIHVNIIAPITMISWCKGSKHFLQWRDLGLFTQHQY